MNISNLIGRLKFFRSEYGELFVAIIGQDRNGVLSVGDYCMVAIDVRYDKAENCFVIDEDKSRKGLMDKVSDVIDSLNAAMTEHGDIPVQIQYMSSKGNHGVHGNNGVGVDVKLSGRANSFFILF